MNNQKGHKSKQRRILKILSVLILLGLMIASLVFVKWSVQQGVEEVTTSRIS